MSSRVLANAGVFALGIILVIGGAWGISRGSGYIQLEWGWTSVISGTVALTGGVLTVAVGLVLRRLDALHGALVSAGAAAGAIAPAEQTAAAAESAAAAMPLGVASAPTAPEPVGAAAYADPALTAAQAINLELLEHEQDRVTPAEHAQGPALQEPHAAEAVASQPPEVIHAADQGPADDMIKAAGVSDEPELDAAIEQLLAEERGRTPHKAEAMQTPPIVAVGPATDVQLTARQDPESAAQRAGGWRGLFSRKERRAVSPLPPPRPEEASAERASTPEAQESPAEPEPAPAPEPIPVQSPAIHTDAIPRTGDDWFDRALSGLDEVYDQAGEIRREQARLGGEREESAALEPEIRAPAAEEAAQSPATPAEPAVIGRYTSGNTTYIMFADGSIEAETPTGILRFASLADLKLYVEGQ